MKTLKTFLMTLIFAVGLAISANATTHSVVVTSQTGPLLTPSNLTVTVGDTVKFVNFTNNLTAFKANNTSFTMSLVGGSYTYAVTGSDYPLITLKDFNGSTTFGTISVQNNISTFIKANDPTEFNIKFFPNPCSNLLNIESNSEIGKVNLFDINGRLIYSEDIKSKSSNIDISTLNSGIYFIQRDKLKIKIIKN